MLRGVCVFRRVFSGRVKRVSCVGWLEVALGVYIHVYVRVETVHTNMVHNAGVHRVYTSSKLVKKGVVV